MNPDQLQAEVTAFLASARAKATGGLTVAEFGQLVVELIELVVTGLDGVASLDGPANRQFSSRPFRFRGSGENAESARDSADF